MQYSICCNTTIAHTCSYTYINPVFGTKINYTTITYIAAVHAIMLIYFPLYSTLYFIICIYHSFCHSLMWNWHIYTPVELINLDIHWHTCNTKCFYICIPSFSLCSSTMTQCNTILQYIPQCTVKSGHLKLFLTFATHQILQSSVYTDPHFSVLN